MANKKKLSEYTDRELLEKNSVFMKRIADNTSFIKVYLIVITLLSFVGVVLIMSKLG